MATQRFRHSRRRHNARRTQHPSRRGDPEGTPHQRAIRRLAMEIGAREQLMGLFHGGVSWRALACLVDPRKAVSLQAEKAIRIGGKRFVPDLVVRCGRTDSILLVVEVWHTHSVTERKKDAFASANLPWIEVRSWHVISRFRKRPLPVLDWGGPGLPEPPGQGRLFDHHASRDDEADRFSASLVSWPPESLARTDLQTAGAGLPSAGKGLGIATA